ncbi:MAG: hypothetical protein IJ203_00775 [Atopobiaceae bacterium]|nr:hypothetical protein [Atopobiaceae bacterium]
MSKRTPDTEDDNYTIADMSGVRDVRPPLWVPRRTRETSPTPSQSDFADELQSNEERLMVILGTLRAALSVGMVYIVVFGLVIAAMVLLWT